MWILAINAMILFGMCMRHISASGMELPSSDKEFIRGLEVLESSMLPSGMGGPPRKPKIKDMQWENCGKDSDPYRLNDVGIRTLSNGDIQISVSTTTTEDINAPIKVEFNLKRQTMGMFITVPCFKDLLGSCTYPDVCKFGFSTCPIKALEVLKIPCKCPVPKGNYGVKMLTIPVPKLRMASMVAGNYQWRNTSFRRDGSVSSCYNGTIVLE